MTLNELLTKVKMIKKYVGKSHMCSGNEYKVVLSHKGKWVSFHYHDNFKNKSNIKDILYCLWLDATCYEESSDYCVFARMFGYDDMNEAKRIYNACKKQSERLHKLFSAEEIDILSTIE